MGRAVGTQLSRGACSWGKEAWWGRVLIGRVPRGVEKSLDPQRLEGQRGAWPAMGVASEGRGQRGAWCTHFHSPIPSAHPIRHPLRPSCGGPGPRALSLPVSAHSFPSRCEVGLGVSEHAVRVCVRSHWSDPAGTRVTRSQ